MIIEERQVLGSFEVLEQSRDHVTDKEALVGNGIFDNVQKLPWIFRMVVNRQVPHSIRSSRLSRKQIAMIRELLCIDERKQVTYSTILVTVRRSYII